MRPYIVEIISKHVKGLQRKFLNLIGTGSHWDDVAIELLTFIYNLGKET